MRLDEDFLVRNSWLWLQNSDCLLVDPDNRQKKAIRIFQSYTATGKLYDSDWKIPIARRLSKSTNMQLEFASCVNAP